MEPRTFKIHRFTYTVDFPVLVLFVGVFLDIVSTMLFVALGAGREANVILGELIKVSIWFIQVYLLTSNPIYVPFLPEMLRKTIGYTFGLVHTSLALNNFSLVLFQNAFLVDTIGFNNLNLLFVVFGFSLFGFLLWKEKMSRKVSVSMLMKLVTYLVFLVSIQALYWFIPWRAIF